MRAAVQQANTLASNDVIIFASTLQTITLALGTEIAITDAGTLTINGTGANVLTVDGGTGTNRIFSTDNATVIITDLTLTGGGANETSLLGGAIYVKNGSLTIDRVHVTGNTVGFTSVSNAGVASALLPKFLKFGVPPLGGFLDR